MAFYKKKEFTFYVYIMTSNSGTLYVGLTNDIARRAWEHKQGKIEGFTKQYKCTKLIYYEFYQYISNAIKREKEIKGWKRYKKEELIKKQNPHWKDLAKDWYQINGKSLV